MPPAPPTAPSTTSMRTGRQAPSSCGWRPSPISCAATMRRCASVGSWRRKWSGGWRSTESSCNGNWQPRSRWNGRRFMAASPQERQIEERVEAYRRALLQEVGLGQAEVQHFRRPYERGWPQLDRANTTIIYFRLTAHHQEISLGVLEGLGDKAQRPPIPGHEAP